MDDPSLDVASLNSALEGLRRLNAVSWAERVRWRIVEREARQLRRPIRVLDVACAAGDWVLTSAARARRVGLAIDFTGSDINASCIALARARAQALDLHCDFVVHDAICSDPACEYDVVTTSLFLHHLHHGDAATLLARMAKAARSLVIVNDLVRSRLNLWMVTAASQLLTRSSIVHTDAARSVRAAFTRRELLGLAERAGLRSATIHFGGLGRMMLVCRRAS